MSDKTPTEIIDDDERNNSPVKETQMILDEDLLKHKAKDKARKQKKTELERERDEVRCQIDLITYQHHLMDLGSHLQNEKKRSRMRLDADLDELEFKNKKRKLTQEKDLVSLRINLKTKKKEWNEWVDREPEYPLNPLIQYNDNTTELVVSDRVIELNGVITYSTSEHITERINYYNHQNNERPIFLIIDYSPGGSVMSGYRILTAMKASRAPIYVVVKSFAASMAAAITTMAEHSFIYPNAIMLHHQIASGSRGNLKQQEEQMVDLKEWWRRLAEPIASRLGITTEEWRKMMYQHNSDGDWREFGDKAVELGWVQQIVNSVRHTSIDHHPDKKSKSSCFFCQSHNSNSTETEIIKHDQTHEKYLPQLRPLDHYWIHDTDHYKVL